MATLTSSMYNTYQTYGNVSTISSTQLVQQQMPNEEQFITTTFFCRALYDYDTDDSSSLSFRRNDIIEVLTRLESGWWDGLLRDERGWFPSNYVEIISDDEAETALSGSELSSQQLGAVDDSIVDFSHAFVRDRSLSETEGDWLPGQSDPHGSRNEILDVPNPTRNMQSSDFWEPKMTEDGQIFYVNTQTGQHSRDLPREAEEETSDSDFAGLTSQSSPRSGTSAGLGLRSSSREAVADHINPAGFGIPNRNGTPDPWVRRLADDGMSYYYWNKLTGDVTWTLPEADPSTSHQRSRKQVAAPASIAQSYHGNNRDPVIASNNGAHYASSSELTDGADHLSLFSDDSDIQSSSKGADLQGYPDNRRNRPPSYTLELTSAEKLAQALQDILAPPPPELVTDLSLVAREAIRGVIESIQMYGPQRNTEQDEKLDELVGAVVIAIRNLLYIAAPPSGHIPSHLVPRDSRDNQAATAAQTLLKPAQRKVTATLSKLVLSARAMLYDSGASVSDTPTRIEGDAEELERAMLAFVLEVQRTQNQALAERIGGPNGLKRLKGVLSTTYVGLGLVGAGVGGSWKGFGWVPLVEDEDAPDRILGSDVMTELRSYRLLLEEKFASLGMALRNMDGSFVYHIVSEGRDIVAHLSTFLSFASNIHIARHVDIDGVQRELDNSGADDLYAQNVAKARVLVRNLEATMQALYDDGASLLLMVQSIHSLASSALGQDKDTMYDYLGGLVAALKANLGMTQQTLEALLAVGQDQADLAQGDYVGSIEWRMSRLSIIGSQLGGHMRSASGAFDADKDDIVNLEVAFQNPSSSKVQPSMFAADNGRRDNSMDGLEPSDASYTVVNGGSDVVSESADDIADLPSPTAQDTFEGGVFEDEIDSSNRPAPRPSKIQNILGPEVSQIYINTLSVEQTPWYLRPNYSQTEIIIDPDGAVRGGTIQALVERLTAHEHGDPSFIKTFLMTYKSFTNLDELFDLLVQRFRIEPPEKLKSAELEEWKKLKQHVIQMRVLNTFKSMVVDEDVLEKEDIYILQRMKDFVSSEEVSRFAAARQLNILIERAQRGGDTKIKTLINAALPPPPPAIVPKNLKSINILDVDPLELARHLTIMESTLYQKIKPMECLQRSREQKVGENNDSIAQIIQTSNRIANWVADTVLSKEDSRRRANIVKQFIGVADRCRGMHNYSSMAAIVAGLNSPPIRRLKRTWEQVSARYITQLSGCEMTIDSNKNFNNYRSTLAKVSPPCIPFIGVFLTILTFIQDGSKDDLPGNLINFRKRQKAAEVIQDIKRWQSVPYNFQLIPPLSSYLEQSLSQFQDHSGSADKLWDTSLLREPREREDEKMARLLQESGFL